MSSEAVRTVVEATPPVAIGGTILFGLTPSNWILVITALVLIVQLATGLLRLRREWRDREKRSPKDQ